MGPSYCMHVVFIGINLISVFSDLAVTTNYKVIRASLTT